MLNRCDRFQVPGMEIEIAIADRKSGSAAAAHQPGRAAEEVIALIRGSPTGFSGAADAALECRKNLRDWLCHDPFSLGLSVEFEQHRQTGIQIRRCRQTCQPTRKAGSWLFRGVSGWRKKVPIPNSQFSSDDENWELSIDQFLSRASSSSLRSS